MIQQHFTLRQTPNQQPVADDRDWIDWQVVANDDVLVASGMLMNFEENYLDDVNDHQPKH